MKASMDDFAGMPRYVQINSVPNGSTGSIMMKRHRDLLEQGVDSYVAWGRGRRSQDEREFRFGTKLSFYMDVLATRISGRAGSYSRVATRQLLRKLDELDPDIVHLHNIHGYYVNVPMLFEWLASHRCQVRWTLHDCWAFTGHCAYFTYARCEQWKTFCGSHEQCGQLGTYPKTFSKSSCAKNYARKKHLFSLLPEERVTLITPSQWLADLTRESFLSKYPVEVQHNTIDNTVFKPTLSDFREKHGIANKHMILGVASPWTERKGLADFVRVAEAVDDSYAVVLVGLNEKEMGSLPDSVIALSRTDSREELAEIYSAADVFFNPTREDNYPTVNLEAEACGTPVVTYDTGGCAETVRSAESKVISGLDEFFVYLSSRWGGCLREDCEQ